jgi:hypothetical protein
LTPIEDPNIELARVNEWRVVVPKGEFEVGEQIIYFEIDSQQPDARWCENLEFYDFHVNC